MAPDSSQITDAEFAVLEVLWDTGPQTIRELTARLYPNVSVSDYATVGKLLERLEAKGGIRRDRTKHVHVIEAARDRRDLIDSGLQQVADKLCEGSLTPLLLQLVEGSKLKKSELAALRKLLDEQASSKKSSGRRTS